MYTVIPTKAKTSTSGNDYMCKSFKALYNLIETLTVPLSGRYSVGIKSESIKDVKEFIADSDRWSNLTVNIYMPESSVEYMLMFDPEIIVKDKQSAYDIFLKIVTDRQVLFERFVPIVLYNSISHEVKDMEEAIDTVVKEYGKQVMVTERMLSKLFILNKVTYPRSVLLAYLKMGRWRESMLRKSIEEMGNDVVFWAMCKNIKKIQEDKAKYYKTGMASNLIKQLSEQNICRMYKTLVTDREGVADCVVLLKLYEKGVCISDIVQRGYR